MSPVVALNAGVSCKAQRMLNTKFDAATHLRLMWEADAWTRRCHCLGIDVLDSSGGRGDLFFLIRMFSVVLKSSIWVWPGRTWTSAYTYVIKQ